MEESVFCDCFSGEHVVEFFDGLQGELDFRGVEFVLVEGHAALFGVEVFDDGFKDVLFDILLEFFEGVVFVELAREGLEEFCLVSF